MSIFLETIGLATLVIAAFAAIVCICVLIEKRFNKAREFEDWKENVTDTLIRLESTCNYLESQARKSEKAKPEARRK